MSTRNATIAARKTYEEGRQLELDGNISASIKKYQKALKQSPVLAVASNRLMIIYRKQKEFKKELAVILQAIEAHEQKQAAELSQWADQNKKSAELSRKLAKSLGLLTSTGIPFYEDKQVTTWKARMALVKKKLK